MMGLHGKEDNKRLISALFFATFIVHFVWVIYVSNTGSMAFIESIRQIISNSYKQMGFKWGGLGSYVFTAALLSSLIANAIRRFLEGAFLGWPRFKKHDKYSLDRVAILLLIYGAMMYFAVGFLGEKYSFRALDFINLVVITFSTYIVGLLVDLVDDTFSAVYSICQGDSK